MSNSSRTGVVKTALAVLLLATLAVGVGAQMVPGVPLPTVLLYAAAGAAGLALVVAAAVVVSLTFRQFILRKGGTDAQWLWFGAEPKGLASQRGLRHPQDEQPRG